LLTEELHDLYSSPSIWATISSLMRWAGNVACMRGREVHTGFWWGYQMEGDHLDDLGIGGRIMLLWILMT